MGGSKEIDHVELENCIIDMCNAGTCKSDSDCSPLTPFCVLDVCTAGRVSVKTVITVNFIMNISVETLTTDLDVELTAFGLPADVKVISKTADEADGGDAVAGSLEMEVGECDEYLSNPDSTA